MIHPTYKNVCTKVVSINPDGTELREPKVAFDTLDKAIIAAKSLNSRNNATHKAVAYKCNKCYKYHVGRSKSPLVRERKNITLEDFKRINQIKSNQIKANEIPDKNTIYNRKLI
jgi:hypothetical protein